MLIKNTGEFSFQVGGKLSDGWFVRTTLYTEYPQTFKWIDDFVEFYEALVDRTDACN